MSKATNSFIEQRARILAMVQLTTRTDLHVDDLAEDSGFDLLVRIAPEGEARQFIKAFGVELKGTIRPVRDTEDAARHLRGGSSKKRGSPLPKYSFPVLVLLFSMQDDRGYYAWRAEPAIARTTEPRLRIHETLLFSNFDRVAVGEIVARVDEWYDKLFVLLEAT
jgi:hypothetical protein